MLSSKIQSWKESQMKLIHVWCHQNQGGFVQTILLQIEKRNSMTLGAIINEFISKKASLLITDKLHGYSGLREQGYEHFTINHNKNFVQSGSGNQTYNNLQNANSKNQQQITTYNKEKDHLIHTQFMENRWKYIKQRLIILNGCRKNYLKDIFKSFFICLTIWKEILWKFQSIGNQEEKHSDLKECNETLENLQLNAQGVNDGQIYGEESDNIFEYEEQSQNLSEENTEDD